jgi:uncharacterized protein (TIGR03435 family)
MKIQLAIPLLAGWALFGQSPVWQEFAIGPATEWQSGFPRNGIRAKGVPLKRAVAHAYGVPENRVFGPRWIADERYAITAIVADPKDFQPFFQQELSYRFHLIAHRETRDVPVFVLKPLDSSVQPAVGEGNVFSGMSGGSSFSNGKIKLDRATLATFVEELGNVVGRPILDETHMDGRFDVVLNWQSGSTASLQKSVKEQLGFQLSDERRPVELLVIDHIEKLQFPK